MTNLLRKCENCVFGNKTAFSYVTMFCRPKIPSWIVRRMKNEQMFTPDNYVDNSTAEDCDAFRLRDTGVNE